MDSPTFLQDLSATLLKFRESQLLCDTMLVIADSEHSKDDLCFWAHSIILAAASSTLCAAFVDRKAAPQWCRFRVLLPGCDPTAVEAVLHFLYTGQLNLPTGFDKSTALAKIFAVCETMGVPVESLHGTHIAFSSQQDANGANGESVSAKDFAPVRELSQASASQQWLHANIEEPKDQQSSKPVLELVDPILDSDIISHDASTQATTDSNSILAVQDLNGSLHLSLEAMCTGDNICLEFGKTANGDLSDFGLLEADCTLDSGDVNVARELSDGSSFRKTSSLAASEAVKSKTATSLAQKLVSSAKQRCKTSSKLNGSVTYTCIPCGKTFTRLLWYKSHTKRFHEGTAALFTCSTCSREFLTRRRLRMHEFLHTTHRPHVCDVCGKAYRFLSSMVEHAQTAHSGGRRPYLCELCGSAFAMPIALRRHMQRRHFDDRPHCCTNCSKRYATRYQLNQHALSCHAGGAKPYSCKLCGTSFTLRHNMLRHEQLHNNPSAHTCPICSKLFRQKQNLTAHVKRLHASGSDTQPTQTKNHVCTACAKSFRTEATLKRHALQHTGNGRTHVCSVCNKGFTQGRYLTAHLVVHKEKQNVCPFCSRRFVHAHYLATHVKRKHSAVA